jgi:hypothetical protein
VAEAASEDHDHLPMVLVRRAQTKGYCQPKHGMSVPRGQMHISMNGLEIFFLFKSEKYEFFVKELNQWQFISKFVFDMEFI